MFTHSNSVKFTTYYSRRTVVFSEIPNIALKLSVGISVSSALRTISHFTANFSPRFSKDIVPKLAIDSRILTIEQEIASVVCSRDAEGVSLDPDIAKHLTVVIRKQYPPAEDEAVIICAALLETGHSGLSAGVPVVQHITCLDAPEKRVRFFDESALFQMLWRFSSLSNLPAGMHASLSRQLSLPCCTTVSLLKPTRKTCSCASLVPLSRRWDSSCATWVGCECTLRPCKRPPAATSNSSRTTAS